MAKNKEAEAKYIEEGKRRNRNRKVERMNKFLRNREFRKKSTGCMGCGEDPYCYCGDGTPYSY